jgi:molybdopterin-guanine dinucleotide biosynthesis protein A
MSKRRPIGAVLAGGRATRLGGDKARAELAGRPLIAWPLAALGAVLEDVAVVAKETTPLPELPGVEVWSEPDEPHHPVAGIVTALERACGRAVVVCAADMPLVTVELVQQLLDEIGPAVVFRAGGRLQPLLARYEPETLAALRRAPPDAPLTDVVAGLGPRVLEAPEERPFFNVNTPQDLAAAAQFLSRGS